MGKKLVKTMQRTEFPVPLFSAQSRSDLDYTNDGKIIVRRPESQERMARLPDIRPTAIQSADSTVD